METEYSVRIGLLIGVFVGILSHPSTESVNSWGSSSGGISHIEERAVSRQCLKSPHVKRKVDMKNQARNNKSSEHFACRSKTTPLASQGHAIPIFKTIEGGLSVVAG